MMSNWKAIWNKQDRVEKIILEMLIKADGFDSPTGGFEVDDWLEYTASLYEKLGMKEDDTIFDVGCGSGAFVYPLYIQNHIVGGVDYSDVLIALSQKVIDKENFRVCEASALDVEEKYDIVLSHSVFFYFPSLDYAKNVIEKMIQKANKTVAIFDINDSEKESNYHAVRMQTMDKETYKKKYAGLEHLFYSKEFFYDIAKEHDLEIVIWDQEFDRYNNSKFRFNVLMRKL